MPEPNKRLSPIEAAVACYVLTSLIAFVGVSFGRDYLQLSSGGLAKKRDLLGTFANWDGEWYVKIAERGYEYDPARQSSVAFSPAYPLLGRLVADVTGLRIDGALLLVSQLFMGASFILLAIYLRARESQREHENGLDSVLPDQERNLVLLAFGLWPMTCFFRVAYSESLFLFMAMLALYAMERRWPVVLIALLIGFETAVRSVGVALGLPFAMHIWRQSGSIVSRGVALLLLLPLSCWGLLGYMGFQASAFGTPLAFMQTHENWFLRKPEAISQKAIALATFEPVWLPFTPSAGPFWRQADPEASPFFDMAFVNSIFFVVAAGLIALGAWKKWLTANEVALAVGLLAIPYFMRSYEMRMMSFARFASVVFPVYLVVGRLLTMVPEPLATALFAVSGFFLGAFAALFAAWYPVI